MALPQHMRALEVERGLSRWCQPRSGWSLTGDAGGVHCTVSEGSIIALAAACGEAGRHFAPLIGKGVWPGVRGRGSSLSSEFRLMRSTASRAAMSLHHALPRASTLLDPGTQDRSLRRFVEKHLISTPLPSF